MGPSHLTKRPRSVREGGPRIANETTSEADRERWPPRLRVTLRPFTYRREGQRVILGDAPRTTFLAIGEDGLEYLLDLARGLSVGEANEAHHARHGSAVDPAPMLDALLREGFLLPEPLGVSDGGTVEAAPTAVPSTGGVPLGWLWCGIGVVTALAVLVALGSHAQAPSTQALIFHGNAVTAGLPLVLVYTLMALLLHESAHVVAARAAGSTARVSLSHRLYMLVAQTTMHGLWSSPKPARLMAYLAGPLLDAMLAATWTAAAALTRKTSVGLLSHLFIAFATVHALQLVFQLLVYTRTDFYYAIADLTGHYDLLPETEQLLLASLRRVFRRGTTASAAFQRPNRVVTTYAVVYLVGRFLALVLLVFVGLPLMLAYGGTLTRGAFAPHDSAGIARTIVLAIAVLSQVAGLGWWLMSLARRLRRRAQTSGSVEPVANTGEGHAP